MGREHGAPFADYRFSPSWQISWRVALPPQCAALTAVVLSFAEIRATVNEMLEENRVHFPTFRCYRA
jgi:hypothetical protein